MFIELIDVLRCTRPHEDSWLVAAFYEMRDREVVEGVLSCPVCGARYVVKNAVAYFDVEPGEQTGGEASGDADPMRVAAFLNLVEPGIVVLEGDQAYAAAAIGKLGNTVIALNSDAQGIGASHIRSDGVLPVARETIDGIALRSATPKLLGSAAHALKAGARLLAPAEAPLPAGMVELARDERNWVAVREGSPGSAPVQIGRR